MSTVDVAWPLSRLCNENWYSFQLVITQKNCLLNKHVQRWDLIFVRGWVKFFPALAYLFCLALPGSCLTRSAKIKSHLCTVHPGCNVHGNAKNWLNHISFLDMSITDPGTTYHLAPISHPSSALFQHRVGCWRRMIYRVSGYGFLAVAGSPNSILKIILQREKHGSGLFTLGLCRLNFL